MKYITAMLFTSFLFGAAPVPNDSPLHQLCRKCNYVEELSSALSLHGKHLNSMNNKGHTPLSILCTKLSKATHNKWRLMEAVRFLIIEKKANLNIDKEILHHVITEYQIPRDGSVFSMYSLVESLLQFGCLPNYRAKECGSTPLHFAIYKGNNRVIALLLEKKANPNIADYAGNTPLHSAAAHGYLDLPVAVKNLLDAGADTTIKNNDGKTALELFVEAKEKGRLDNDVINSCIKLLSQKEEAGSLCSIQ